MGLALTPTRTARSSQKDSLRACMSVVSKAGCAVVEWLRGDLDDAEPRLTDDPRLPRWSVLEVRR
jgi:hypothetical protein